MKKQIIEEKPAEEVIEEKKISVPKFTRPEITDELTQQNIKDIIESQAIEIKNLENEIVRKKACMEHYTKFLA